MAEEKQPATQATTTRSIVATGNTVATPVIIAGIIGYVASVIKAAWPEFPVPSDAMCLYFGLGVAGVFTWWSSYSIRGTQVNKDPMS